MIAVFLVLIEKHKTRFLSILVNNSLYLSKLILFKDSFLTLNTIVMKNEGFTITNDLYATQFQRFLNLCIDLMFIYIIVLSLGTTIILVALSANNFALTNWVENMAILEVSFYSAIVAFLYYYFTEVYFSRTIAKLITHTIVVNADGSKPSGKRFFIRTCCRFIPFEAFTYFGEIPRGWHDSFSETYVVKKRKLNKMKKDLNTLTNAVEA